MTAGAGLTGGGAIDATRTFAVGAGTGITVNADDVAINLTYADARWLGITATAANSTKWGNYNIVVTATPGSDPNTIYFVT